VHPITDHIVTEAAALAAEIVDLAPMPPRRQGP
jgi:hypothetical protein